jgi:pilus assembly protein CpaE
MPVSRNIAEEELMYALPNPAIPMRALVISPDQRLSLHFEQVCADLQGLKLMRVVSRYPAQQEFVRLLRIYVPQVIFVSVENIATLADLIDWVKSEAPSVRVIGIHSFCDSQLLLEVMRIGIQEFLYAPFDKALLGSCLARVQSFLSANPVSLRGTELLYSFLPAKPGVGATTLAVNTAVALAKGDDTRVFLGDFDLNCGLIRFMLQLRNTYSVLDASQKAEQIDENLWPQLVTSFGTLDVMHAGALNPQTRLEMVHLRRLLDYLRRAYRVVCADLSGNMEKYSLEIMHESKQIFLVTTPELPALHLAREKFQFLANLDLGDRVTILLNRHSKHSPLSTDEIENLIGRRVVMNFPNDYRSVHTAVASGTFLNTNTHLGAQCARLASTMLSDAAFKPVPVKRRFIEYFSLIPAAHKKMLKA